MYRITDCVTGKVVGYVDTVTYIKKGDGCLTNATPEEAIGVAVDSVPYNLLGHEDIEDASTVVVSEFDGGKMVKEQQDIIETMMLSMLGG